MKRFFEPASVRAIRQWLRDQMVGSERVDPFEPVEVGPYETRPRSPNEVKYDHEREQDFVCFRVILWVGGLPTHEARGEVRRIANKIYPESHPWEVAGEIIPR